MFKRSKKMNSIPLIQQHTHLPLSRSSYSPGMAISMGQYSPPSTKGVSLGMLSPSVKQQFSKTKMCPYHCSGRCNNGANCSFAHDETELRPLPDLKNTKLCDFSKRGIRCTNPYCLYAHSIEALRPSTDLHTFKTALCFFWKKGTCFNGNKCRFAHGKVEVREKQSSSEQGENVGENSIFSTSGLSSNMSMGFDPMTMAQAASHNGYSVSRSANLLDTQAPWLHSSNAFSVDRKKNESKRNNLSTNGGNGISPADTPVSGRSGSSATYGGNSNTQHSTSTSELPGAHKIAQSPFFWSKDGASGMDGPNEYSDKFLAYPNMPHGGVYRSGTMSSNSSPKLKDGSAQNEIGNTTFYNQNGYAQQVTDDRKPIFRVLKMLSQEYMEKEGGAFHTGGGENAPNHFFPSYPQVDGHLLNGVDAYPTTNGSLQLGEVRTPEKMEFESLLYKLLHNKANAEEARQGLVLLLLWCSMNKKESSGMNEVMDAIRSLRSTVEGTGASENASNIYKMTNEIPTEGTVSFDQVPDAARGDNSNILPPDLRKAHSQGFHKESDETHGQFYPFSQIYQEYSPSTKNFAQSELSNELPHIIPSPLQMNGIHQRQGSYQEEQHKQSVELSPQCNSYSPEMKAGQQTQETETTLNPFSRFGNLLHPQSYVSEADFYRIIGNLLPEISEHHGEEMSNVLAQGAAWFPNSHAKGVDGEPTSASDCRGANLRAEAHDDADPALQANGLFSVNGTESVIGNLLADVVQQSSDFNRRNVGTSQNECNTPAVLTSGCAPESSNNTEEPANLLNTKHPKFSEIQDAWKDDDVPTKDTSFY